MVRDQKCCSYSYGYGYSYSDGYGCSYSYGCSNGSYIHGYSYSYGYSDGYSYSYAYGCSYMLSVTTPVVHSSGEMHREVMANVDQYIHPSPGLRSMLRSFRDRCG